MLNGRVLHYVRDALPVQAGYTLRTQAIAASLQEIGYRTAVGVVRPVFGAGVMETPGPFLCQDDVPYFGLPPELMDRTLAHRMLTYLLTHRVRGAWRVRRALELSRYRSWLETAVGPVSLVHAHSPPETAVEASRFAAIWKVPLVYEVRGFWKLSEAAEDDMSVDPRAATALDVRLACKRGVGHVAAICRGVADQLVREQVDFRKISIVPNGVDATVFHPRPRNDSLAQELGLDGRLVYAYATNVRRLEGIQCVIKAWPDVVKAMPEAVFLLIGDGAYLDTLKDMARDAGLGDTLRFLGRVPHAEMWDYYSLIDVFVVPRVSAPVCQLVTPLKPLEAMAMGIPVVVSGVSALREMVCDGETGLVFEADDPQSLARVCVQLGRDCTLRKTLAAAARAWVEQERVWPRIAARYHSIYSTLLAC